MKDILKAVDRSDVEPMFREILMQTVLSAVLNVTITRQTNGNAAAVRLLNRFMKTIGTLGAPSEHTLDIRYQIAVAANLDVE